MGLVEHNEDVVLASDAPGDEAVVASHRAVRTEFQAKHLRLPLDSLIPLPHNDRDVC